LLKKSYSRSKLLQTNRCRRSLPAMKRSFRGLCALFFMSNTTCLFLIIIASKWVKTKTKMKLCETEMKKDSLKWKRKKSFKTEMKLKHKLHSKNEMETETKIKGET